MTRVEELLILLQEAIKVQAGVTNPHIAVNIYDTSEPDGIDFERAHDITETLSPSATPVRRINGDTRWLVTDLHDDRIQLTIFYQ